MGKRGRTAGRYALLVGAALVIVFPVYVTLVNSVLPGARFFHYPPDLFPVHATFEPYRVAWREAHLARYLVNSALVASSITAAQIATSILAAYAFTFIRFPLRGVIFGVFLATTMVPF